MSTIRKMQISIAMKLSTIKKANFIALKLDGFIVP